MPNIKIFQSKDLNLYKPILEGLTDDLGFDYYHAILIWCGIINDTGDYYKDYLWESYLIEVDGEIVGFANIVSQREETKNNVWLEWIGILPKYQGTGIGTMFLNHIEDIVRGLGCDEIYTYIDSDLKAGRFYQKNGYHLYGTIGAYLEENTDLPEKSFGYENDIVLVKNL